MPRIIVLLDKNKTQITNSSQASLEFPETGKMPDTIEFDGREFAYLDQPTHETDHPGAELYRYVEAVAAPTGSTTSSTAAAAKSGPGWSAA